VLSTAHHIEQNKEEESLCGRGAGDELKRGEGRQQAVEARHAQRHQQISTRASQAHGHMHARKESSSETMLLVAARDDKNHKRSLLT